MLNSHPATLAGIYGMFDLMESSTAQRQAGPATVEVLQQLGPQGSMELAVPPGLSIRRRFRPTPALGSRAAQLRRIAQGPKPYRFAAAALINELDALPERAALWRTRESLGVSYAQERIMK